MKSHPFTAPDPSALRAVGSDQLAGTRLPAVWGTVASEVAFGCPVCGASLRVMRRPGEVAGLCPVCRSVVVVPQPELGCRAMTYRDWLRMQEFESDDLPATAMEPPRPVQGRGSQQRRSKGDRRRPVRWAAAGSLATVLGLAGWMIGRMPLGTFAAPLPVMAPTPTELPEETSASAASPVGTVAAAPSPSVTPAFTTPHSGEPTLAHLLNRSVSPETGIVVEARQVHDFARSAPPADGFLCLKLVDPTATARVYFSRGDAVATSVRTLLPWGSNRRVTARLCWREADAATGLDGYWGLVSIDDAPSALSSAR